METFEMPFKLGNDAKAALVGEICTCRLWRQNRAAFKNNQSGILERNRGNGKAAHSFH